MERQGITMIKILDTMNAGYRITGVIMTSDETGAVMAVKEVDGYGNVAFAIWSFNTYDGQLSFYWGHYVDNLKSALEELNKKVIEA